MKKAIGILLMLLVVIVGCSDSDEEADSKAASDDSQENEAESEVAENSDEDKPLKEVGDASYNSELQSDVELIAKNNPDDTIELGSVDMTIDSIMIMRLSDVRRPELQSMMDDRGLEDMMSYVQIAYTIENKEDTDIRLNSPVDAIVLNTGEQIETFENDLADDHNFARDIHGKVKDESYVGIVIEDSDPEDIDNIKVVTGRIDKDSGETLAEPETISYDLETK